MYKLSALMLLSFISFSAMAKIEMIPPTDKDLAVIKSLHEGALIKNTKGTIEEKVQAETVPANWFNLSPSRGIEGVGSELIYATLGEPTTEKEIIVAVVDSGVDVNHEDLQGKVWINNNEIADNGLDDDNNGYVDDVFGWNFIGGKEGMATVEANSELANGIKLIKGNPEFQTSSDTLEVTRELVRLKKLKKELSYMGQILSPSDEKYLGELTKEVEESLKAAQDSLVDMNKKKEVMATNSAILRDAGLSEITLESVRNFESREEAVLEAKKLVLELLSGGFTESRILRLIKRYTSTTLYYYNEGYNPRSKIVGDDYSDPFEKNYGNNDVTGPDSSHGTHVAGIIAANRDNRLGIKGVATKVKIMAVRCVPDGDERDKDVANSIIYAVDNGAKIINMSFGKNASPFKTVVDEAMKYAESKGVLLVHAAGNSSQDNDLEKNFPNRKLQSEKRQLVNWLEIGASAFKKGELLPAKFSNFGKNSVDLFSPGVDILSTTPDNKYDTFSGTSMASPVAAGVAAALWTYANDLSLADLRALLVDTSRRYPKLQVNKPGTTDKNLFSDLSINGSVIDLYEAVTTYFQKSNTLK